MVDVTIRSPLADRYDNTACIGTRALVEKQAVYGPFVKALVLHPQGRILSPGIEAVQAIASAIQTATLRPLGIIKRRLLDAIEIANLASQADTYLKCVASLPIVDAWRPAALHRFEVASKWPALSICRVRCDARP